MEEKENYVEVGIDYYPDKDSVDTVVQFLQSLQQMSKALNKSSEIAIEGGAGFNWELKIMARGKWT